MPHAVFLRIVISAGFSDTGVRNPLQNKRERRMSGSVVPSSGFSSSSAPNPCGTLCLQDQVTVEQQVMQASVCRTIGPNGVCEVYTCEHYSQRDCQALEPMLEFMDPTAAPKQYFDCDTLRCIACPSTWQVRPSTFSAPILLTACCGALMLAEVAAVLLLIFHGLQSCEIHAQSGCVYDSSLDEAALEAKFVGWRYEPPSAAGPAAIGALDICGSSTTPVRGVYNVDYVAEMMDPIDKCTCGNCFITMNDNENRMQSGGYIEYCNLNICSADGTRWEPSGGFAITDAKAGASTAPESFRTLKEISDTLGVSPEVRICQRSMPKIHPLLSHRTPY